VVLIVETDSTAIVPPRVDRPPGEIPEWCVISNTGLMATYLLEMLIRLYVDRLQFFSSWLNIVDMTVVVVDTFTELLVPDSQTDIGLLRVCRLLRLRRTHRHPAP